jgi:monoamine oxidase
MARTPLFRYLQRSLELARYSLTTPEPADELVDRLRAEHAIGRREFVGISSTLAAGLMLGACSLPRAAGRRRLDAPVLVVGAGIAGLTAAHRLRQAGVPVRLIEAQERVGGRMYSLRDHFADGQAIELGGELIDTGHTQILRLAGELGITLDDLAVEDDGIDTELWHFEGRRRSMQEVVAAFRPVALQIRRDLAALPEEIGYGSRSREAQRLDRMTIAEWLDAAGVDGWFRTLLDVGYTTEFGLEIDNQSALNLLTMIDPEPDPFHIYGESDERFRVREGNDRIVHALASHVEDAIEPGTRLEAVSRRADGQYTCSVARGGGAEEIVAPYVVLAIPFTLLRQVRMDVRMPAAKTRAIRELGYGTNAKLMIGFDRRVWREQYGSNGSVLTDRPFQLTWETSRHQPGRAGILTNFTGGRHGVAIGQGTAADQAERTVASLETIYPGIAATRAGMREARFHWPSHPWTLGSYACYLPGQWTTIAGAEGEHVDGLIFAGEHCSAEAQGFMEGGCETGESAAARILAELGLSSPRQPAAAPRARASEPAMALR